MKRTKGKRGLTPPAAALLLVVCASVAWFSLAGQFGGGAANGSPVRPAEVGDPGLEDGQAPLNEGDTPGRDLLAEYGSWTRGTPVRMAFASAVEASAAAVPIGETGAAASRRWIGKDPPALTVGVLMVGDASRRAVVNGVVVGLGDTVERATIVGIERDAIAVTWGDRRLTYGLDSEYPREFQNELRRREAARDKAGSDAKPKEEGQ